MSEAQKNGDRACARCGVSEDAVDLRACTDPRGHAAPVPDEPPYFEWQCPRCGSMNPSTQTGCNCQYEEQVLDA